MCAEESKINEKPASKSIVSSVQYPSPTVLLINSTFYRIFEFFFILAIIVIAISSIYNISARETLSKSIENKIIKLNSEFVSSNSIVLRKMISKENGEDIAKQIKEISELDKLALEIKAIKSYGSVTNVVSFENVKSKFIGLDVSNNPIEFFSYTEIITRVFSSFPSDVLLAFTLMSCAALGAVTASIRSKKKASLSTFTVGFTTGFIAYLGIKGGQFVFLLHSPEAATVLNPYTASFVGLLSGMFSERFHLMLAHVMDKAFDQFKHDKAK